MFKRWFLGFFFGNRILLSNILIELRALHYHVDRMEYFYMHVNNIKEEEKIVDEKPKS